MTYVTILRTAIAVLGLGALAPGCVTEPDEARGSFCAAPISGEEFCVRANQSPAGAWNQAAAHGDMPIQMWATWPDDVSTDELVASKDKLNAWFADIDTVVAFVRDDKRSAESYKASIAGHLGDLLGSVRDRQIVLLEAPPVDAIGNFKAAMGEKAKAEKDPLVATIAGDKQSMAAAQAIFDQAKKDAAQIQTSYAGIVTDFTPYRATEAAEMATYAALAQQGSQATLATLPDVEQAVLVASLDASNKSNDLTLKAMKLSAQIQAFELSTQTAIAPYRDFLATHGAALPDMTSGALRSLNAMLGYIQARVTRSDATATSLLNGLAMRKEALTLLDAPQPLRDKIAQAKLLKAGAAFDADAKARVSAIAEPPPVSAKLKLPYLAARYDQLTAVLQMGPLCDPTSSWWRETGCTSLRANTGAAEAYKKTTLPALLKTGLATMRANGADPAILDAAQAKLDAGDIKGAAMIYDAAVAGTEAP